jgi:hypothetical protein
VYIIKLVASTHTKRASVVIGIMIIGGAIAYLGLAIENAPVQVSGGIIGIAAGIYSRVSMVAEE